MKIALINENSQAAKNEMIYNTLKSVVEPMGHEVFNYGMYSAEDANQLTYVQIGILTAVLINSGAADLLSQAAVQAKALCLHATLSLRYFADISNPHWMLTFSHR